MTGASSRRSPSLSALARPLTSLVLTLILHLLLRLVRTVDDVGSLLHLTLTLSIRDRIMTFGC